MRPDGRDDSACSAIIERKVSFRHDHNLSEPRSIVTAKEAITALIGNHGHQIIYPAQFVNSDMSGIIYAWETEDIQAVDEGNFGSMVIDVAENFFSNINSYEHATVNWKTETRDHGVVYEVTSRPLFNATTYLIEIEGGRGGEYELELTPNELLVRTVSSGYEEELTYLELRAPEAAVDTKNQSISLKSIPEQLRKRLVRAAPTIRNDQ